MTATVKVDNNGRRPEAVKEPQTLEEFLAWAAGLNARGVDLLPLTQGLLRDKFRLEAALDQVRAMHGELREQLQALTAPQRYPAVITEVHNPTERLVEVYG